MPDWLEFISAQHWQTIDMGLHRMQQMVERLALQRPAKTIITVAGTNGKGSTCLGCEELLLRAGFHVGSTLSPHVHHFNERIRVDGSDVSDAQICEAFAAVDSGRDGLELTYFEFATLASLWIFQQSRVDVAILEIGLGGRLDAYNVIDADIAVITSIGLDHEIFLGDTREQIGFEKAGILREGQQVVLGPDMPRSVLRVCTELRLQPQILQGDCNLSYTSLPAPPDALRTWALTIDQGQVLSGVPIGSIAPENLALAYLAASRVTPIDHDWVAHVSRDLVMPGRMQFVQVSGRTWLLDVAHNPAGAAFLVESLALRGITPGLVVCGMLSGKDHAGVVTQVSQALSAPWLLVDTQNERAMSATQLADQLAKVELAKVDEVGWHELIATANSETNPGDVILLFGSFSVVEQFAQLQNRD